MGTRKSTDKHVRIAACPIISAEKPLNQPEEPQAPDTGNQLSTQSEADAFMLDLGGRIVSRTQLTGDGLGAYAPTVENALGPDTISASV